MPDEKLICGVYVNKKDQDFVDFMVKQGLPEDEVKPLKGTVWRYHQQKVGSKFVGFLTVEGKPELNQWFVFGDGTTQEMEFPLLGPGKHKVRVDFKSDGFLVSADTSYGDMVIREHYSEEGISSEYTTKGAKYCEKWCRDIKTEGWFRYDKDENLKNYMVKAGFPESFYDDMKDYKMHVKRCDEGFLLTEYFGKMKITNKIKQDVEADYTTGDPMLDRRYLQTKIGPFSWKWIAWGKNGEKEEFDIHYTHEGVYSTGTDKKTGQSCKMWMKPFTNICGTFKPVSFVGSKSYFSKLGLPDDVISKIETDYDSRIVNEEIAPGVLRTRNSSKVMPHDAVYKFGEETEVDWMGTKFKEVLTMSGDTICGVAICDKFVAKTTVKFTENFSILTSQIQGLPACWKVIYQRVC